MNSAGGSVSSDSQSADASGQIDGVSVRNSVNDYSWDELKQISDKIASAASDDEGLQIAEQYHLCSSDGKLDGTQAKDVTLTNGTKTSVQIVGFRHDDKSDGSGKAGITFMFYDAIACRQINPTSSSAGGWQSCQMRSWLASSGMELMPSDLQSEIVSVRKMTNNTGKTEDASSVTATNDSLWLFSLIELGDEESLREWTLEKECNQVLKAEGSKYQLFSDVPESEAEEILHKTYQGSRPLIWLRTPDPVGENGDPIDFAVIYKGIPEMVGSSTKDEEGVVPGFCI